MSYRINQNGRVVLNSTDAHLPAKWDNGPVYEDAQNQYCLDFAAWLAAGNVPTPYAPSKDEQNAPILRELEANDKKAIRALLEGDSVRVSEWKAKQAALRARLK